MKIYTLSYWGKATALPILLSNLGILWAAAKSGDFVRSHILDHLRDQCVEADAHGINVDYMIRRVNQITTTAELGMMRLAGIIEGCIIGTHRDNKHTT